MKTLLGLFFLVIGIFALALSNDEKEKDWFPFGIVLSAMGIVLLAKPNR